LLVTNTIQDDAKNYTLNSPDMFAIGEFYPPTGHAHRLERYRENKKLFLGKHYDVFERMNNRLSKTQRDIVYISVNIAGLVCKKSADFLFGETPSYSAGRDDQSNEQQAIERLVTSNDLNITNYESALGTSYRGDSFYKIRWGQRYEGALDVSIDPFRIFIDAQNAEYVFPETSATDANNVIAYHVAYPVAIEIEGSDEWFLYVESHYAGKIIYRKFRMDALETNIDNVVKSWKIYAEITEVRTEVETGIPFPLIVHVPNFSTDDSWEGIDDLSEIKPLLDELNNRLSLLAVILDKHSDPAIAIPAGAMDTDENGQPIFHVGRDKVFEVMDKNEVIPQYITWDGQLNAAFKEIETLIDMILMTSEIPAVALGKGDSGTSGSSGLSIKWRMNSLLAKINRKRQYYDRALRRVLLIAQLVEHDRLGKVKAGYDVVNPIVRFKDGLPDDELEQAQIYSLRLGGKSTLSQKSAIMRLDNLTEEQADRELGRIQAEDKALAFVDSSVFNAETKPTGTEA